MRLTPATHVFFATRTGAISTDKRFGRRAAKASAVIEFDPDGNVVNSWGEPTTRRPILYMASCTVDPENNVWITGTGDGMVQKYSHDGSKLLLQIGKQGLVDSSGWHGQKGNYSERRPRKFLQAGGDGD